MFAFLSSKSVLSKQPECISFIRIRFDAWTWQKAEEDNSNRFFNDVWPKLIKQTLSQLKRVKSLVETCTENVVRSLIWTFHGWICCEVCTNSESLLTRSLLTHTHQKALALPLHDRLIHFSPVPFASVAPILFNTWFTTSSNLSQKTFHGTRLKQIYARSSYVHMAETETWKRLENNK